MNLHDSYSKLYEEAISLASTIANPYERATIYTNVMNSLATIIAGNSINTSSDVEATTEIENVVSENVSVENDTAEASTNDMTAIDKAADGTDDEEWTERMIEKYSEEITYVNSAMEQFEEDELNKFVHDATNGVYNSFSEMGPTAFVATYTLLKQAIEQAV